MGTLLTFGHCYCGAEGNSEYEKKVASVSIQKAWPICCAFQIEFRCSVLFILSSQKKKKKIGDGENERGWGGMGK